VIAIPAQEKRSSMTITSRMRKELELFFRNAVAFQEKDLRIEGWGGAKAAARAIVESARR
jgi:hypothetical protein